MAKCKLLRYYWYLIIQDYLQVVTTSTCNPETLLRVQYVISRNHQDYVQSVITELVADYVQVVTIDTCYTKIIYNLLMLITVTLGLCSSLYCYIYNPVQVVITERLI